MDRVKVKMEILRWEDLDFQDLVLNKWEKTTNFSLKNSSNDELTITFLIILIFFYFLYRIIIILLKSL